MDWDRYRLIFENAELVSALRVFADAGKRLKPHLSERGLNEQWFIQGDIVKTMRLTYAAFQRAIDLVDEADKKGQV